MIGALEVRNNKQKSEKTKKMCSDLHAMFWFSQSCLTYTLGSINFLVML